MQRKSFQWIALALLVASATIAQGQAAPLGPRITIGPFVGMNYTTVYGSDVEDTDSRWDWAFGGQLDAAFGGAGLFRTGLLYSGRGAEGTEDGLTIQIKLRYLEIPLLLGYRFPTTGARPYVLGGAQLGFKTGCTFEGTDGNVTASFDCDDPDLDIADFKTFDFGAVAGGGVIVPFGGNELTFDLRYTLGLTKIEETTNAKNRGFTVGVGLMIPIAR